MRKIFCFAAVLSLLLASCGGGQKTVMNTVDGMLPRAEAVSVGFDPAAMETFYAVADTVSFGEFHSIMVLRHGKVVAEKWWGDEAPDKTHVMYSVSKSFAAAGMGFAVSEGLFSLDDKVVSFFPDKAPAREDNPLMQEMTVRDLLIMSTGQDPDENDNHRARNSEDWVWTFMDIKVKDRPGTIFRYNSAATFMLSAIVQQTSGQKLFDYLQPRLFAPLEMKNMKWDESPQGITVGGWGLHIKTEDMAKFGQLFLQKGVWNGRQVLPQGWVEEASSWKISNGDPAQDSDWSQGYCYQMWRCRHNAYRADGAYGQYIIVIPEKDAVVAVTAKINDMQAELNMVWDYILPAFK